MRTGRFDPATQVFDFSHVPKCGGTTVHDFLGRLTDDNYMLCDPHTGWQKRIDTLWGAGGHQTRGQNPISQRKGFEVVRLIIMREPLQRILSFYRHVRNNPGHYLAVRPEVKGKTLLEFAQYCEDSQNREFCNLQSQFVTGPHGDHTDLQFVLDTFDREFDFYGPLSMLPVLREELSRFFGKPSTELVSRNVSREVPLDQAEVRAVADIVYRNNYNDVQLYNACVDKFMRFLDQRARAPRDV